MRKSDFVRGYVEALESGNAGLFVGAGLSMRAGYPSWRSLVRDMAKEIGLDSNREADLAGVVQFFLNRAGRTRTRLARTIVDHFGNRHSVPRALNTLARLPLRRVWTTNYDDLIERAWSEQRRRLDVKSLDKDLVSENPWSHAVLYKMHGTVDHPSDVVISKGDYEAYRRKRPGFLHLLTGQLVSQRMLFLGFSFTDPNLSYLFTVIRESFEDVPPEHFTIVRRPKREDYRTKALFTYAAKRHALWIEDLQNYGIQSLEVDEYEEIDDLLDLIERRLSMKSVLISGSYPTIGSASEPAERTRVETISEELGSLLARKNYRIVSGFGLSVGSAVLSGALAEYNNQDAPSFDQNLYLRPFPQRVPAGQSRKKFYQRYREDLVMRSGVCIFISGVTSRGGKLELADGVMAEFEIAAKARRLPIPLATTGGAAKEIWERVAADYKRYCGKLPKRYFNALNNSSVSPASLSRSVDDILHWLADHDPYST